MISQTVALRSRCCRQLHLHGVRLSYHRQHCCYYYYYSCYPACSRRTPPLVTFAKLAPTNTPVTTPSPTTQYSSSSFKISSKISSRSALLARHLQTSPYSSISQSSDKASIHRSNNTMSG